MTKRRRSECDDGSHPGHLCRSERGAIIIHVAIAMLGLLAFSAFSIDHGVMMVSRGQAQNAADAGALAAALYLAWDDGNDQAGAQAAAVATAQLNSVWGSTPDVTLTDVTFPTCPPGAPGPADTCVRVDVFRNQRANGNPLPVFFSTLIGVVDQGVKATATAQVLYGDGPGSDDWLKPFAIADRWAEIREDEAGTAAADDDGTELPYYPHDEDWGDTWDADDNYDAYYTQGGNRGNPLPGNVDIFDTDTTGFELTPNPQAMVAANDNGVRLVLKDTNGNQIVSSWYNPYVIEDGCGNGANCYRNRISGCSQMDIGEGTALTNEPGNMVGPTRQGVAALIAQDFRADWVRDATHPRGIVRGGMGMNSPRLGMVPTFNPEIYMEGHQNGRIQAGNAEIVVTGMLGIFFDEMVGNDVMGHISTISFGPSPTNLTDDTSSFLRTVILVR